MLGNNKEDEKEIKLEVVSWNTEEYLNQSREYFEELVSSVKGLGVNLSYRLEKNHDRFIEANNGNKIIMGRGLDIFEKREGRFSIGDVDQSWRKCKACEITYITS
jgi:ATP-dependent Lon protease